MMMSKSNAGTVLSRAAWSGSRDTFEAAVAALETNLTHAEVILDQNEYTLLCVEESLQET